MTPEELAKAKEIADDLIAVVNETLDEGILDMGAVAFVDKETINFAMGMQIADPKKVESTLKDVVEIAKKEAGEEFTMNLNNDSHKGVTFHELVVKIPEGEQEAIAMFGENLTIIVGIGDKDIYVGAGVDPMPTIKKVLDNNKATGSGDLVQLQYNVFLAPILRFAAALEGEEMVEKMAAKLSEVGGDRLRVTSKTTKNGISMQFEAQDGVLQLIGVVGQAMSGQMGPAEDF
jgi:hypothetical protein